ncbi:hypothetical protein GJ496_004356 [Pomphorhynchus laevis]|nr:hypothetical protein GJ496_004356 [Pomphorhynchus laevis]
MVKMYLLAILIMFDDQQAKDEVNPHLCQPLPAPINGYITYSEYGSYQSTAAYRCNFGYQLDGPSYRQCNHDGLWYPQSNPRCIKQDSCTKPEDDKIHNAVLQNHTRLALFKEDDKLVFQCKPGFNKINERYLIIKCLSNGQWLPSIVKCELYKYCKMTEYVSNGEMQLLDRNGEPAQLPRFELIGSSDILCQSNEQWSNEFPKCADSKYCKMTEYVSNGEMQLLDRNGEPAQLPRFELLGSSDILCQSNEQWSNEFPKCVDSEYCKMTEYLPRFELLGSSDVLCQSNEQWSNAFPECISRCTDPPPVVKHARIFEYPEYREHKLKYQCVFGYELSDKAISEINCEQGKWSEPYPNCRKDPWTVKYDVSSIRET